MDWNWKKLVEELDVDVEWRKSRDQNPLQIKKITNTKTCTDCNCTATNRLIWIRVQPVHKVFVASCQVKGCGRWLDPNTNTWISCSPNKKSSLIAQFALQRDKAKKRQFLSEKDKNK